MSVSTLITGGSGFIGSHLARNLVSKGKDVVVIDNFTRGSKTNLIGLENKIKIVEGGLKSETVIEEAIKGCDQVYHFAARIGGVGYLRDHPATILKDNNLIDINVFDACVKHKIKRLVYARSSMLDAETKMFPSK